MRRAFLLINFFFSVVLTAQVRTTAKDVLLILGPDKPNFQTVRKEIGDDEEIREKLDIRYRPVNFERTTYADFASYLDNAKPKYVILMDNLSIEMYGHWAKYNPVNLPITIACMGVFVGQSVPDLGEKVKRINYEVPAVLGLTKLREILNQRVSRIGVIYRKDMHAYIDKELRRCRRENFQLITYAIEADRPEDIKKELRVGLENLMKKDLDAFWIMSDTLLLKRQNLEVWLAQLADFNKPIMVNVERMVEIADGKFGNFAVLPDHQEIGIQIVNILSDLLAGRPVAPVIEPTSKISVLNITYAQRHFRLNFSRLDEIDRLIE